MGMASYFEDGREKHKRFADTAQGKKKRGRVVQEDGNGWTPR